MLVRYYTINLIIYIRISLVRQSKAVVMTSKMSSSKSHEYLSVILANALKECTSLVVFNGIRQLSKTVQPIFLQNWKYIESVLLNKSVCLSYAWSRLQKGYPLIHATYNVSFFSWWNWKVLFTGHRDSVRSSLNFIYNRDREKKISTFY
jgi:hypothetical protein